MSSNSKSSINEDIILKEIIQRPKGYVITPEFSTILILGEEEAVIKFEYPVDSAIVILSISGYKINVEVRSSVIKHVHCSGITIELFSYMNFNGTEWIKYHGHRIVERLPPLISSFDNRKDDYINTKNGGKAPYCAIHTTKYTTYLCCSWNQSGKTFVFATELKT